MRHATAAGGDGGLDQTKRWERRLVAWRQEFLAQEPGLAPDRNCVSLRASSFAVVGDAGVGKSALIDALLSRTQRPLPRGGVGPLTGAPCRIVFAEAPRFRVRYREASWLETACSDLEREIATPRMVAQISMLFARPGRAMRALAREVRTFLSTRADPRHKVVRAALLRKACTWTTADGPHAIVDAVRDHVSGPLGALCEWMELGWPSALLQLGIELVDLPGLGVAHDPLAYAGRAWIERADGILVCVDRAGLTESTARALATGGFLERVVKGESVLAGAVLKLDAVASDHAIADRNRPWTQHLSNVRHDAERLLRAQLATALEPISPGASRMIGLCPVAAVSSHEYQRWYLGDPDELPRVQSPEDSGIPSLARKLVALHRIKASGIPADVVKRRDVAPDLKQAALSALLDHAIDEELMP